MNLANTSRASLMEQLALASPLDLFAFCARLQDVLKLPAFGFGDENLTAWGIVEVDYVTYDVSRPFTIGTLHRWDPTAPAHCSFGITLVVNREHPHAGSHEWALENLVLPIGKAIADHFGETVFYHRTWLGVGQNVERDLVFQPSAG